MSKNPTSGTSFAPTKPVLESLEDRNLLSLLYLCPMPVLLMESPPDTTVAYEAAAQALDVGATQLTFFPAFVPVSEALLLIDASIDNSGALVAGDNQVTITGTIDADVDGTPDYTGTLLTGQITQFGSDYFPGSGYGTIEFRATPTGGALMPFFQDPQPQDIGIVLQLMGLQEWWDGTTLPPDSIFTGGFTQDFLDKVWWGGNVGTVERVAPPELSSLSGLVYVDANNNGAFDTGEDPIPAVQITLDGIDASGAPVDLTTTTLQDGTYRFDNLKSGTYAIIETQPADYLDGAETLGTAGGTVWNDCFEISLAPGFNGAGYNFGELLPASSLSGFAYVDFNDDGAIDFSETALGDVTIILSSAADPAQVIQTTTTDADGFYIFEHLAPGTYVISEQIPAGYINGQDNVGSLGGEAVNNQLQGIVVGLDDSGSDYDFGHRPQPGAALTEGQTAGVGFWQNKNGQRLLKSLNDGSGSTQLGNWLAASLPNIFGPTAGINNLAGRTNAEVASYYVTLFKGKGLKLESQVMATALAVYVTNVSLASTTASSYGFNVTTYGTGIATFNVGSSGAAFGVANNTNLTVLDALLMTDQMSLSGVLYNGSSVLRNLANAAYSSINQGGSI